MGLPSKEVTKSTRVVNPDGQVQKYAKAEHSKLRRNIAEKRLGIREDVLQAYTDPDYSVGVGEGDAWDFTVHNDLAAIRKIKSVYGDRIQERMDAGAFGAAKILRSDMNKMTQEYRFSARQMEERRRDLANREGPLNMNNVKMAFINEQKLDDQLVFQYNPTTISDNRTADYTDERKEGTHNRTAPLFKGSGMRQVSFTLFWDDLTRMYSQPIDLDNGKGWLGGYGDETNYDRQAKFEQTHGQYTQPGGGYNVHYFGGDIENTGPENLMSCAGAIHWLRTHLGTDPEVNGGEPPKLLFNALYRIQANPAIRLFQFYLDKVDVEVLATDFRAPWTVRRANISVNLKEFTPDTWG